MAVYTEVTQAALEGFLKDYDLGRVTAFKGIAGGVENTNYLLDTDQGRYILTLYEKRVAEADLPFFMGLMDHLAGKGFPCPEPVRKRDGTVLGRLENRAAALVTFLEGVDVKEPSLDQCRMAGEALAHLHEDGQDCPVHRANALAPSGWKSLADAALLCADEIEDGLSALIEREMINVTAVWPDDLPQGVIHADWFCDNIFFLDGRLSGVIDFYFACNDTLTYDLAIAINAWCFDQTFAFQADRSAALVAGYESVRALTEAEKKALPVLCRGAALRFLLTRVNDWLNVPPGALVIPHNPKAFSARLRFHQSAAGPQTYGAA
jgi:homoserine kinase type II